MHTGTIRSGLLVVVLVLSTTGCAAGDQLAEPSLPTEFREACGRPGQEVVTKATRVVIPLSACDLTGVTVVSASGGGVLVPDRGEFASSGEGPTVSVDADSGDVVWTATPAP